MKLSAKARYAVMAVTDLAVHDRNGQAISLSEIATRQGISLAFLEQVFAKLRRAKIVNSTRGAGGGYQLARSLSDIFVGDIIFAVEETIQTKRCRGGSGKACTGHGAKCLSHDLWQAMEDHIEGFLAAITIEDVLAQRFPLFAPVQTTNDAGVRI